MLLLTLIPIFAYFLVGVLLRSAGLAGREHGTFLFRLVFFVTLPALAFGAIANMTVGPRAVLLPLSAMAINAFCMTVALWFARRKGIPRRKAGALILGAGITNMAFMFPFVLAILGSQALADAILFDLGNAVFVATAGYLVALRFGHSASSSVVQSLAKTLTSPLFIAIAAAIVVNVAEIRLPDVIDTVLSPLGSATIPLILIALGISFSISGAREALPIYTIILRMPLGFLAGLFIVWSLNLDGVVATIIVVSAAAPIGFSSVTLASVTDMDTEQAAAALSMSVGIGLFSAPLLLWAMAHLFSTG